MKHPIRSLFGFTILAGVSLVNSALAVNIDWVQVGNPGNGTDPRTGNRYGAVGYGYPENWSSTGEGHTSLREQLEALRVRWDGRTEP